MTDLFTHTSTVYTSCILSCPDRISSHVHSRIPLHRIIRTLRSSVSLSLSRRRSLNSLIPFLPLPPTPLIPCFHLCRMSATSPLCWPSDNDRYTFVIVLRKPART